jgi:DNA-binding NtrC family response regulator
MERRHIARVLKDTGGRVRPAAERLGISPSSLYDRIRRLQIPASGF